MLLNKPVIIFVLFITIGAQISFAQMAESQAKSSDQSKNTKTIDPRLTEKGDRLLNTQAEIIFDLVNETLDKFSPQYPQPLERRLAFSLLDCVLHDVYAPARPPVHKFIQDRMLRLVKDIEHVKIEEGAKIWRLYNQGFIVRTKTVTLGFDIIRYSNRFQNFAFDPNDILARIAEQCDVLFISHSHPDHADEWVAQQFIAKGKPVVAPPDFWQDKEIFTKITHLVRKADELQSLLIQNGSVELKVLNYPGHQFQRLLDNELLNNVYLIFTPDELTFSHVGDQNKKADYEGTKKVGEQYHVDVHFHKTTSSQLVSDFDPEVVIGSHENELGHGIDHRIPYWRYNNWSKRMPYPLIVMAWGEKYHYKPSKKVNN